MSNQRGGSTIGGYISIHLGNLLVNIKNVCNLGTGDGSGIDVDTVDGKHASDFATASHSQAISTVTGLQTALDSKATVYLGATQPTTDFWFKEI